VAAGGGRYNGPMLVTEPLVNHRADGTRPGLPVVGPAIDPFTPPVDPTPLGRVSSRAWTSVAGRVESAASARWAGSPVVELTLTDGTGTLLLVFTGRRELAGARPGRRLAAAGRIGARHGSPMLMNPTYWLLAGD
jgi:hypothetical protein